MFMGGWVYTDYICHLYICIHLYTRFPNLVASSHLQGRHQSWYFDSSSTRGVCIIYKLMIKILGLDSFLPVIQIIFKKKKTYCFVFDCAKACQISDPQPGAAPGPLAVEALSSHCQEFPLSSSFARKSFPGDSDSKESACHVGDPGSIPVLGRSPGEQTGNPLHYFCLENPMDRGTFKDKQSMLFCRKEGKLDLHKNKQHLRLDKIF